MKFRSVGVVKGSSLSLQGHPKDIDASSEDIDAVAKCPIDVTKSLVCTSAHTLPSFQVLSPREGTRHPSLSTVQLLTLV